MARDEKGFKKLFVGHLGTDVHYQHIETGSVGTGIPDTNFCHEGREQWIEFKVVVGKQVGLMPTQVAWIWKRTKAGGHVWVIARDKYDGVRKGKGDTIYMWPGAEVREVKEHGVDHPAHGIYHKPFDWPTIMGQLLCGP
tara:strand:+ start:3553 stop:3969 length:417 start_codon:yes stop_codon:yes gene_type:complete